MNPPSTASRFEDFLPRDGTRDLMDKVTALEAFIETTRPSYLDGLGLRLQGPTAPRVTLDDGRGVAREGIMLASNSYLGMTTHPRVVAACKAAADTYGYGMGAVSLYAGICALHRELETLLAGFHGTEDVILFPCGYSGNVGVISALCGPGDVVINDAANHASIFDGCRLSGAEVKRYLHRDMRHLERILRAIPPARKGRLIITDGVFSMHGDLAPLDEILALAERYNCRVMIDEAHGIGVIGPTGRGTIEHFGCEGRVDLVCGTLSKAPAAIGGYCAGSASLVRYLRYYARTYFFSTSIPAPIIAGLVEVMKLLIEDKAGRQQLWHNIHYLRTGLRRLGFDTGDTMSAIIPVLVGDEDRLGRFQTALRDAGVFTNVVTYPAVRRKECRLRVSVMSTLTRDDMDLALTRFAQVGRSCGVIP